MTPEPDSPMINRSDREEVPDTPTQAGSGQAGGQGEVSTLASPWRDGIDYFDKLKFIEPDDAWMDQPIREGLDYLRTQPATSVRFTFDNNVGDYQVTFDDGQIPTDATITPTNEPGQPTP